MMCKCCKAVRPVIRNVILDREESIPVRCDVMSGLVGGCVGGWWWVAVRWNVRLLVNAVCL